MVKLPEEFEIGNDRYCIIAKVNHLDGAMSSGHYTADIKVGKWKHCDDRRVTEMRAMAEISKEAYLVFCEKKVR